MPPALTQGSLVGFAYLSLVVTGVAFVLWIGGVARLPVSSPPLLGLAAPITRVIVGWLVLGEDRSQVGGSLLASQPRLEQHVFLGEDMGVARQHLVWRAETVFRSPRNRGTSL
jgi:hypothetical protein